MTAAGKIVLAGLAGTTAMTLFSYTLSLLLKENFREPELLSQLLIKLKEPAASICAWAVHYGVGFFFAFLYLYFRKNYKTPALKSSLLFGFIIGLVAIITWHILLLLRPDLSVINRNHYYVQLVIAHIIFGIFIGL